MSTTIRPGVLLLLILLTASQACAEVLLPNIFGDHMVLQRDHANPVWGKATPDAEVTVAIADQEHRTNADAEGYWRLELDPMQAGGPHELIVTASNTVTFVDVLVGEVWVSSGQSNMEWSVNNSNHQEVEVATAKFPQIRLMNVPRISAKEPQFNFGATWQICSPETVGNFSATAYFFGRSIHQAVQVPVGIIDTSWGGACIEAFVLRERLEGDYAEMLEGWEAYANVYTDEVHAELVAAYEAAKEANDPDVRPQYPYDRRERDLPGVIYNGRVHPFVGYGIRGVIWCQGESNVPRAHQYRRLFPTLITTWRELWGQGDFPFYWVQLANFHQKSPEPQDSPWAELREAQTLALELPNTGEAIVLDIGQANDVHPGDKQTAAARLVRHALAKDYDYDITSESPRFASMTIKDGQAIITFDHVSRELFAFNVNTVQGFAIAGEDKKFVWAQAEIVDGKTVKVWSEEVPEPVAVRYAFEINPTANLYDRTGLPVTPFRTDDWPGYVYGRERVNLP